jgi:hypothetical protein
LYSFGVGIGVQLPVFNRNKGAIETFIRSAISAKFCFRNIASIWSEDNLICRAGTDTPIKEIKTMSSKRIINIVFCGQK